MAIKLGRTMTNVCVHIAVGYGVAYALTGSASIGGLVALIEPVVALVAHHLHDKAWAAAIGAEAHG
ncbi:MAG: DUF2061 domain-containing protein [Actinomycetota bacterium]